MKTTTQSLLVYGPQGCGKTRNAKRIARALGLTTIVDDFQIGCGRSWPREGALLLSQEAPPNWFRCPAMSFKEVMQKVPA